MGFLNELFRTDWWIEKFKKWFGGSQNMNNKEDIKVSNTDNINKQDPINKQDYSKFDPTLVLPDSIFGYGDSDDLDITNFLKRNGSFLGAYVVNNKSVEEIIKEHCKYYNVNPKWVLASLQREQGLISCKDITVIKSYTKKLRYKDENGKYVLNPDGTYDLKEVTLYPLDWCLGFGVPDFDMPMEKFRGFENQISNCARRSRELFDSGLQQIGKNFETLDYTIVSDKMKEPYIVKPEDSDGVKKSKEDSLTTLIKNAQNNELLRLQYKFEVSDKPEKYLIVPLKGQWPYLLYMYTPHVLAAKKTYELWQRYWIGDIVYI